MKIYYATNRTYVWALILVFICGLFPAVLKAQQLKMTDFVLFGGTKTPLTGQTQPLAPGYAVQLGSSSNIQKSSNGPEGSIGSYKLVKSTGNFTINGNIYSEALIQLTNSNVVTGKIAAGTLAEQPTYPLFFQWDQVQI